MFQEEDRTEIGVIIQECQGKGLAHMVRIIHLPLTVIELETLAISKALQFDADLSLEDVTPEGVSKITINALNADSQSLESFGLLSHDVKCFASLFHYIKFSHVHREGLLYSYVKRNDNGVAHSLAKNALCIPDFQVWMEDVPSHIGNDKEIYVPKWYQSLGMDQRVEQLEQNVSSLVSGQQQLIEKMADIYAKISELSSRREAQLWYQLLQQETDTTTWATFKTGLLARYGPTQFYDHFGELTKLQQTSTVKEYQSRFEQLLAKVGYLPPPRQVSCFVSRLKESIKADVLAGRPLDLTTAIGLARLFEARKNSLRRPPVTSQTVARTNPITSKEKGGYWSPMPVRRLSPAELKERRDRGLCYNCNEKFSPGYRCKKLFLIEACTTEEDGDVSMELELEEEQETPSISLHAISGDHAPETMKVSGKIGSVPAMVLLDSGSSHNFISESLAQKLVLQPAQEKKIRVMVASGERLTNPVMSGAGDGGSDDEMLVG
nr:hypothetical protein CFP56_19082 [Quercus suber]